MPDLFVCRDFVSFCSLRLIVAQIKLKGDQELVKSEQVKCDQELVKSVPEPCS